MSNIKLLQCVTLAAKVHQVSAVFVELENMITGVAVRQDDVAVGSHGDGSRTEPLECES